MTNVFICGSSGTTGIRLRERLSSRTDVRLLENTYENRRDSGAIQEMIQKADVSFLCLPDAAAREIAENAPKARLIDASTAHRTHTDWQYGFPELSPAHRAALAHAQRTAVPGCHASGFVALCGPLTGMGILPVDYPLSCHSITGYSGGGKDMIAAYEDSSRPQSFAAGRQYAFSQQHKHLPEMQTICGLASPPIFTPVVEDFYSGMMVTLPLHTAYLHGTQTRTSIWEALAQHYKDAPLISVMPLDQDGFLHANEMSGKDSMEIYVTGNDQRVLLIARFDNLGKGASGAAIQCFNLMIGAKETQGLVL